VAIVLHTSGLGGVPEADAECPGCPITSQRVTVISLSNVRVPYAVQLDAVLTTIAHRHLVQVHARGRRRGRCRKCSRRWHPRVPPAMETFVAPLVMVSSGPVTDELVALSSGRCRSDILGTLASVPSVHPIGRAISRWRRGWHWIGVAGVVDQRLERGHGARGVSDGHDAVAGGFSMNVLLGTV